MDKPTLVETGRSTATVYHFRPTGEERRFGGWAHCVVNDETGELLITSDWTDACGHGWGAGALGSARPTLTHFLAEERTCFDYFAGKLLRGTDRAQCFSPERTVAAMRKRVIEYRREGRLTKAVAREQWDSVVGLDGYHHHCDFEAHVPEEWNETIAPWWDDVRTEPTREWNALVGWILPALAEACRAELTRRAAVEVAAP